MEQVRMTIRGLDDVEQCIENAAFSVKDGTYYVMYKETLLGFENASSRLKFKEGCLELTRSGKSAVRMVFEEGKEYTMIYPTPYGMLDIKISTRTVKIHRTGSLVRVLVEYDILGDDSSRKLEIILEQ